MSLRNFHNYRALHFVIFFLYLTRGVSTTMVLPEYNMNRQVAKRGHRMAQ